MIENKFISTSELAKEFEVHPATIVRWIDKGIIPGQRLGPRIIRIVRAEAMRLLNGNRETLI